MLGIVAWLQVLVQESLGGEPHLAFLGSLAMGLDERRFGVVRGGGSEQRVGQAHRTLTMVCRWSGLFWATRSSASRYIGDIPDR
ncbi:hypothetical protein [Amycolatopsis sp. NBC_00438]|uniref:hypothetical protein n=1 Tax=Amycolatopsis sp. NBC_00438 TaxID=2903558 RepID=UPI002E240970